MSGGHDSRRVGDRYATNTHRLQSTLVRVASGDRVPAAEALRNPSIRLADLVKAEPALGLDLDPLTPTLDIASLDADCRYVGYLRRQEQEVLRAQRYASQRVPDQFSFTNLPGLSRELQQRLTEVRPRTVAMAGSVSGMTPAALALVSAAISRRTLSPTAAADDISSGGSPD